MKRSVANGLLVLGSALAAVAVLEAGLRIAGISHPNFYRADRRAGGALRPGAEGWWLSEGKDYVRISGAGLRDREHAKAKPPGTYRIAVLGDSYAEAFQLPMEEAFWSVLERELSRCAALEGKTVEAINFGVSGYGTAQELLTLRHRAWEYSPDLVLLAFTTGNDLRNNVRRLENDPRRPYFVLEGGALKLDDGFLASWRFRLPGGEALLDLAHGLMDRSRVLQVANRAVNTYRSRKAAARGAAAGPPAPVPTAAGEAGPGAPSPPPARKEPGLDEAVYREPADPVWAEAWAVTEALIGTMGDEVRQRGAAFFVAIVTNGIQVNPDAALREGYARSLGVPDLSYPGRRIAGLCGTKGFPVLDLAPPFLAHAEARRVFLHGFGDPPGGGGHWNRAGHRLAGELIAGAICEELGAKRTVPP